MVLHYDATDHSNFETFKNQTSRDDETSLFAAGNSVNLEWGSE